MEEPGGLQSMGSRRVWRDWMTSLSLFTVMHWRRKWQPTPVFLPGESQGRELPSLGSHRVGYDWSNLAAAAAATFPMLVAIHISAECGPSWGETGWESSELYHLQRHSQHTYKWTLEFQSYHEYLLFQALWKTEFISLYMKHLYTHLFKLSISRSERNSGFLSLHYPSHYKMKSMYFQQQNYNNYKGEGKVPALVLDAVCTVYRGPEKLTRIQLKNLPLPVSWV